MPSPRVPAESLPRQRSLRRVLVQHSLWLCALALLLSTTAALAEEKNPPLPETLFLTWQHDPCTTMTITWLAPESAAAAAADNAAPQIEFGRVGTSAWQTRSGTRRSFGASPFSVASVTLDGLAAGSGYQLRRVGDRRVYRFRTAPARLEQPLTFVAGGDAGVYAQSRFTNRLAARENPLFVLLGGDIAYANGVTYTRWVDYLSLWNETMVSTAGWTIPLVVCIGNHEVDDRRSFGRDAAPYFYALFGIFSDRGYAALDFGDYLSVLLLDSGHTTAIAGAQEEWLARSLAERAQRPHLLATYHVPAYPSFRDFNGKTSRLLRQHWVPLFERHGVDVVYENNDHTYKRSHRLKGGERSDAGVLYLGDGSWGVPQRRVERDRLPRFLAHAATANHLIRTTLVGREQRHAIIAGDGSLLDSFPNPQLQLSIETTPERLFDRELYAPGEAIDCTLEVGASGFENATAIAGQLLVQKDGAAPFLIGAFGGARRWRFRYTPLERGRYRFFARGSVFFADPTPAAPFAVNDLRKVDVISRAPRSATLLARREAGVRYEVYAANIRELSRWIPAEPLRRGVTRELSLRDLERPADKFAVVFHGFLEVEQEAAHQFFLRSDDGSRLFIDGVAVVDNDGRHQSREEHGIIRLASGLHAIRVEYFDSRSTDQLEVSWRREGSEREPIPSRRLFRR